ncbi:MAG: hypothetical protein A3B38_02060 [Candidatus Levybacteria bacterium RIFCSPLOWO2_01_FULL_36_13]|nr:MAG: hypothetical protein A2684_03295 [Candidatus Levybacteria bacterium RIFCSPHIGHO2_01_FULL_36_15b]OGH35647.1 MAG: hypothetical protein A3B38_02060 [Candidatus Levybacteria bacterium RIFCSPLOWO2_01_FULL_36_13]
MINPLLSIIVPTKNSAVFLDACIKSIKNQTYDNIEIIVVDNYSTDKTKEIAKKYTKLVFNKGPERSVQRNFGASKAKGEHLLFIDSDMELTPRVAQDCVKIIKEQRIKNADRKIGGIIIPEKSFGKGFWAQCKALERSFYEGVGWLEAARFFPKNVFNESGGYDDSLVSGEDWDLSQRVEKKYQLGRIKSYINHNEGNLSLGTLLSKKMYYSKQLNSYSSKKINNLKTKQQLSLIKRYELFFSNPSKLFSNPLLGIGMLFMKTCEFAVGGIGYILRK